jgi:oxygen-independent coproporphyrinogen III oxidase
LEIGKIGIYVHIPFCKRECFYCHFVKQKYDADAVAKYITALSHEIELHSDPGYIIDTVYIGGGSPSLLNKHQVETVMNSIYKSFKVENSIECTFEMNPEDVTKEKLRFLKQAGINRLSIGTQSFIPGDITFLKRTHSALQSVEAVENALETGFTNINVDFIISLPTQTKKSLEKNFSFLKQYEIPHVSAYLLEEVEEKEEVENRDTRDNDLYFFTRETLGNLGYIHYEISNFSKQGFESKHNLKYWRNQDYIGAGLSASGFEKGVDYKNTVLSEEYFEKVEKNILPQTETTRPNTGLRRIIMGLRLPEGIDVSCFDEYREQLEFLKTNCILIPDDDDRRFAVNPDKLLLLNEILTYFV